MDRRICSVDCVHVADLISHARKPRVEYPGVLYLGRMEGELGEHHSGELRLETAKAKAERIIAEELSRLGWTEGDLPGRRTNDPGKMAMRPRCGCVGKRRSR